jgi:exodeoxyribonuclease VII small subunit
MDAQPLSIEEMLLKLENLARQLEDNTMPFNEALSNYKASLLLLDQCKRYLKKSKDEIQQLHNEYLGDDE